MIAQRWPNERMCGRTIQSREKSADQDRANKRDKVNAQRTTRKYINYKDDNALKQRVI